MGIFPLAVYRAAVQFCVVRRSMNTGHQNQSSGLKRVYTIVRVFIVCLIGFLALLFFLDLRDFLTPSLKLAAKSPLIILTHVDTNAPTRYLVITRIWKQPKDISPKVMIGAKIPFEWGSGKPPEGAVIFYRRSFPLIWTDRFILQRGFFIRQGRVDIDQQGNVDHITVEEFKSDCGL